MALLSGKGGPGVETKLFADVFGHGLVADLSRTKLPAYVPSRNFALAVMESLKDGSQSPLASQVERSIQLLPSGPARDSLTGDAGRG